MHLSVIGGIISLNYTPIQGDAVHSMLDALPLHGHDATALWSEPTI
jgi:lipid-A-disaccharide synthase-like uncharacterized protein